MCSTLMNLSPWDGPAARVAAALKVSPSEVFLPLLPAIGAGMAATFGLAWFSGSASAGASPDARMTAVILHLAPPAGPVQGRDRPGPGDQLRGSPTSGPG